MLNVLGIGVVRMVCLPMQIRIANFEKCVGVGMIVETEIGPWLLDKFEAFVDPPLPGRNSRPRRSLRREP
jgi:hypothetical protein